MFIIILANNTNHMVSLWSFIILACHPAQLVQNSFGPKYKKGKGVKNLVLDTIWVFGIHIIIFSNTKKPKLVFPFQIFS